MLLAQRFWHNAFGTTLLPPRATTVTNPQEFSEEQLREYKEYQAREKAAIEERVKRRAAMEQERRGLRAAALEVAAKVGARPECVGVLSTQATPWSCASSESAGWL
jgi:hypothetical protein